jgi:hypothetical protein
MTMADTTHEWRPLTIEAVWELFGEVSFPWWIAGGVALDLFIGRQTRPHDDIDVQILRPDQLRFQDGFRGWDLHKTGGAKLTPWPRGEFLPPGINQIWCRRTPDAAWSLEIMLMEAGAQGWYHRRTPAVGGRIEALGLKTRAGIPYLAPEIQLLYKAGDARRSKDEADFNEVLPLLNDQQRAWLQRALALRFPSGHPWIARLSATDLP